MGFHGLAATVEEHLNHAFGLRRSGKSRAYGACHHKAKAKRQTQK